MPQTYHEKSFMLLVESLGITLLTICHSWSVNDRKIMTGLVAVLIFLKSLKALLKNQLSRNYQA